MTMERISPRLQKALASGRELLVFGDLWLSTLAAAVDTQAELQACAVRENIDLDTKPGEVVLERDSAYSTPVINNAVGASTRSLYRAKDLGAVSEDTDFTSVWQSFRPETGGDFNNIVVKVTNPSASARTLYLLLYRHNPAVDGGYTQPGRLYNIITRGWDPLGDNPLYGVDAGHYLLAARSMSVAGLYTGEKTVDLQGVSFSAGTTYWFALYSPIAVANTPSMYYGAPDSYAGGACYAVTETRSRRTAGIGPHAGQWRPVYEHYYTHEYALLGDAYFRVQVDGYAPRGLLGAARIDLGEVPPGPGTFQLAAQEPLGTTLEATLSAYTAEGDTVPAWSKTGLADGDELPAYRYWDMTFEFSSDSLRASSPVLDAAELLFPRDRLLLRPSDRELRYASEALKSDYAPLLAPPELRASELKLMERVATGGSAVITLEEPSPDVLPRVAADRPLKNYRIALYAGADEPGFAPSDLCRYFIGIVDKVDIRPRYRADKYRLVLSAKNPLLELKRKAPLAGGGSVDLGANSINHDNMHAADSMYDILRNKAAVPARYIAVETIKAARTASGYGPLAAAALVVRRSNAAGLPDTRIKSPEEVGKLLAPLAAILDGYVVEDESSRIKLALHDPAAAAEEAWADEALVRAGRDAVPIESVESINLGYDDLLANLVYCGYEWDGSGDDWTAFGGVEASLAADSAADYSMSTAPYVSVMEKNMKEVSKWLGPESGYNGASIAAALAGLLSARYAYPPARIIGAVLPMTQFMRTLGSVVTVESEEYARYRRRGIAASEAVKFMVIKKRHDRGKNRMVFDLLELT